MKEVRIPQTVITDRLLTKKQVARLLSLSTRSVDRLCQLGALEKVYLGGAVRFRSSDIARIIEEGT